MTGNSKYTRYQIKAYQYWTVYLYQRQAYLGRCKVALNREGEIDPFAGTTPGERDELQTIMISFQSALNELFQPDRFNYANMRNVWRHCHWHIIPRYEQPRVVGGLEFVDHNWGKNYAPYNRDFSVPEKLMEKIRSDIEAKL